MSKYRTIDVWDKFYGNNETVRDYAGRIMKRSACGNPNSSYNPTLDHIRPLLSGISKFAIVIPTVKKQISFRIGKPTANASELNALKVQGRIMKSQSLNKEKRNVKMVL